ncbi:MAG: hypothetical protein GY930_11535 [bacterium]|nr:hypothetical protein [bacterium]
MTQRKRIRIVLPSLQRPMVLYAFCGAGMSVVLTACVVARRLSNLAEKLPNDGELVMEQMTQALMGDFAIALGVALPAFALLTLLLTMPFVGVLYRFQSFLQGTVDGSETEPCDLRDTDPMSNVCDLLNAATEGQRAINLQTQKDKQAA